MGKRRKRKTRSSGSDSDRQNKKSVKERGPSEELSVSEVLNKTNSILYDSDTLVEEDCVFVERSEQLVHSEGLGSANMASMAKAPGGVSDPVQSGGTEPTNRDIMVFLRGIENRLEARLDKMDKRLDALEELKHKVEEFDKDTKKLWITMNDKTKKLDERITATEERIESCDFSLATTSEKVIELEREKDILKENIVYLQSQSMRNNLIFTNIPESETESNEECETKVRNFLFEKMKVARDIVDQMKFDRVHRMGQKQGGRPRRIVARFHEFKDKEMVRRQWKALEGTPFYVSEQFPREVEEKRRRLRSKLKAAKDEGKRAWIAYDTLYVNGKPVRD